VLATSGHKVPAQSNSTLTFVNVIFTCIERDFFHFSHVRTNLSGFYCESSNLAVYGQISTSDLNVDLRIEFSMPDLLLDGKFCQSDYVFRYFSQFSAAHVMCRNGHKNCFGSNCSPKIRNSHGPFLIRLYEFCRNPKSHILG